MPPPHPKLLDALKEARHWTSKFSAAQPFNSLLYARCQDVMATIDELAGTITGDRTLFHTKAHGSPSKDSHAEHGALLPLGPSATNLTRLEVECVDQFRGNVPPIVKAQAILRQLSPQDAEGFGGIAFRHKIDGGIRIAAASSNLKAASEHLDLPEVFALGRQLY